MAHALDKEEIIKGVLMGLGRWPRARMPGTMWYNAGVPGIPMTRTGPGGCSWMRDSTATATASWKDGRPLTLNIITN